MSKHKENLRKRRLRDQENHVCTNCRKRPSDTKGVKCRICKVATSINTINRKHSLEIKKEDVYIYDDNQTCAICNTEMNKPCLDHCNINGNFRDWLCYKCNTGLGFFEDSIDLVEAVAEYLKKHK